jgi:hypothetical protein
MFKFWSEVPSALVREVAADLATWAWVFLWVTIGARIYIAIAGFAEAGRALARGGKGIQQAGVDLGGSLSGIPVVGPSIQTGATDAFQTAGQPLIYVGSQLVELFLFIATLLGILVVAVALLPWLSRYLPWRAKRLADLRAANKAIRRAPRDTSKAAIERLLASRALHRLTYPALLAETPDPLGDFVSGRYDRLARAELASVGLRP